MSIRTVCAADGMGDTAADDDRLASIESSSEHAVLQSRLRSAVDGLPTAARRVAEYHFGWCDAQNAPVAGGGKMMRARFVLAAARAVAGGDRAVRTEMALPAAVSIELVHNFSLLHDDVIDGDELRRHRPTVWRVFGTSQAILVGDALLARAFGVLTENSAAARDMREGHEVIPASVLLLHSTLLDLVAGQQADIDFENRDDVALAECVAMAEQKTASLFACACALGAMSGGATPAQARGLQRFGQRIGLAFQFVDDLLGIWGDPAVTGKPVHSDLRSRKKSLPVVAALASGTKAGTDLAALYARPPQADESCLPHAAALVEAAGGRAWAEQQVGALLADGLRELRSTDSSVEDITELVVLARQAGHRDR